MAYRFQVDELQREYDAVLIAVGAQRSQRLSIPGEELHSVIPATTFLKEFNLDAETHISGEMAVIGGGSTALDAARSALRSGASKVRILYRRTCEDMPAQEEEVAARHWKKASSCMNWSYQCSSWGQMES